MQLLLCTCKHVMWNTLFSAVLHSKQTQTFIILNSSIFSAFSSFSRFCKAYVNFDHKCMHVQETHFKMFYLYQIQLNVHTKIVPIYPYIISTQVWLSYKQHNMDWMKLWRMSLLIQYKSVLSKTLLHLCLNDLDTIDFNSDFIDINWLYGQSQHFVI